MLTPPINDDVLLSLFPGILLYKEINTYKKLDLYFITGFADAEDSFMVLPTEAKISKIGWYVKPLFQIYFYSKDLEILKEIQSFLEILVI